MDGWLGGVGGGVDPPLVAHGLREHVCVRGPRQIGVQSTSEVVHTAILVHKMVAPPADVDTNMSVHFAVAPPADVHATMPALKAVEPPADMVTMLVVQLLRHL